MPFGNETAEGKVVALPSKINPVVHFGRITSKYEIDEKAPNPFYRRRSINWFAPNIPRTCFDQDILFSFGAYMTICRICQEDRVVKETDAFRNHGINQTTDVNSDEDNDVLDIEAEALSAISQRMTQKVKRHDLTRIVNGFSKPKNIRHS